MIVFSVSNASNISNDLANVEDFSEFRNLKPITKTQQANSLHQAIEKKIDGRGTGTEIFLDVFRKLIHNSALANYSIENDRNSTKNCQAPRKHFPI